MANTGLSTFMHAKRDEKTGEYAAPGKMAGAIEFKETLDRNDAKLYADNELKDSDTSVTGGKLALTVDDDDETVFAPILGATLEEMKVGEKTYQKMVSRTDDEPVYVTFYPKVKFVMGDEEAKSAEDKTEYTKPTVEGTLYPVDGEYKVRVITESLEEAKKVLEALFTPQEAA